MTGYLIPGEVIAAANTALLAGIVYLAVQVARARERIVRLEEWIRLFERDRVD